MVGVVQFKPMGLVPSRFLFHLDPLGPIFKHGFKLEPGRKPEPNQHWFLPNYLAQHSFWTSSIDMPCGKFLLHLVS
jgi:hypothetical protein